MSYACKVNPKINESLTRNTSLPTRLIQRAMAYAKPIGYGNVGLRVTRPDAAPPRACRDDSNCSQVRSLSVPCYAQVSILLDFLPKVDMIFEKK